MTSPLPYAHVNPGGAWDRDLSHLKTLAICHYVWGGLTIAFSSIFIFHIVMGVMFITNPRAFGPPSNAPPPEFGWFFVAIGSIGVLLGWSTGILTIISGRRMARRRSRVFSLVMAGVNCLSIPIGTTLGVFTFVVLLRPSVQALYDQRG